MVKEINVSGLKSHVKNPYFFDNITGDNWDAFLESVRTSGVIEPIVIDGRTNVVVSGHQRVRACKELGIEKILCDVRAYDDEDKILKDLIETNLRQRGMGNPNAVKMGRCLVELERICGIRQGSANPKGVFVCDSTLSSDVKTQEDLMSELGLNKDTYLNYKKLTTLIPEIQELVQDETISPSVASRILAKLSEEEQQKLISNLPAIERLTQKKAEELIKNIKPEVVDKIPEDYESFKRRSEKLLEENLKLSKESGEMKRELEIIKSNQDNLKVIPEGVVQKHDWQHFDEISSKFEMLINPYMYMKKYFEELPLEEKYLYVTKLDSMVSKINKINNLIKGEQKNEE